MSAPTSRAVDWVPSPLRCEGEGEGHALEPGERSFEVYVVYTNRSGTLAALATADRLARKLQARARLIMPYEVPYALALEHPAVPVKFLEEQLRALATHTSLEITGGIYLCRNKRHTLRILLGPDSLVIVGGRKRWWPTAEQKLARALEQDGRHVIFAELR